MQNMTKKTSEIEVKGKELIAYIKHTIREGNVRRVIIKKSNGEILLDIPLTAGVGIGALLLIKIPLLVVISALAGWAASFRVEVIRDDNAD